MGYFPNGTSGQMYEEQYCNRCVNCDGCWIWMIHLSRNYEDSGKPDSILHVLIPRTEDKLGNEQCVMFKEGQPILEPKMTAQEKRRLELEREFIESRKGD